MTYDITYCYGLGCQEGDECGRAQLPSEPRHISITPFDLHRDDKPCEYKTPLATVSILETTGGEG